MLPQGPLVRRAIADAAAVAKLDPTLKILILQGGARPRRPGQPPAMAAASRYPSVMAVGNGQGQWVLVNMSPAVAHPLDRDPLLNRPPTWPTASPPRWATASRWRCRTWAPGKAAAWPAARPPQSSPVVPWPVTA